MTDMEVVESFHNAQTADVYANKDKRCECWKCELKEKCPYADKYQRLPRDIPGALGLCKKLN